MPFFTAGIQLQRPLYWQLLLPQEQHLLKGPPGSIPYYSWRWQRAGWHRVPMVGTAELARWSAAGMPLGGSTAATPEQLTGTNNYLFRLPELPTQLTLRTIPRTILVVVPAGMVLLAGTLLIYLPALRRAEVFFAIAVLLLALGLLYPEPAAILAQMAILGVVLALLALFLRRILRARGPQRFVIERSSGSSARYQTTELYWDPERDAEGSSPVATPPVATTESSLEGSPLGGSTAESGS
jgi:hypothetical protein